MRVLRITANLPVADIEAAKSFYTDFLGLSTEEFNLGRVARYTDTDTGAHVQLVTGPATRSSTRSRSNRGECTGSSCARPTATCSTSSSTGISGRPHAEHRLPALLIAEVRGRWQARMGP